MTVFVLHCEISDQYGTSEAVGVYSSHEKAVLASRQIPYDRRRAFVLIMEVDVPIKPRIYGTPIG